MRLAETPVLAELVLVGFRNELARARTLSFLGERAAIFGAPGGDLSPPCTLLAQVEIKTAEGLCAELSKLGALVRVTLLADRTTSSAPAAVPITATVAPRESMFSGFANVATGLSRIALVLILFWVASAAIRSWRSFSFDHVGAEGRLVMLPGFVFQTPTSLTTRTPGFDSKAHAAVAQLVSQQRFEAALARLSEETQRAADKGTQAYAEDIYRQWIRSELEAGHLDTASSVVRKALAVQESPGLLVLAGSIYSKRGEWDAARDAFEKSLAGGSKDATACVALSEIYRQMGDQKKAVVMLDRAREYGASGSDFDQLRQLIMREQDAESGFASISSAHFSVSFAQGEDPAAARLIVTELERAYHIVGHKLGAYPEHAIPVVLYAAEDFQKVTQSPDWAGALYDGRIKVPIRGLESNDPNLPGILRHEYAHVLNLQIAGERLPVWLNEGVAMWAQEERDGEREEIASAIIRAGHPFKLRELETSLMHLSPREAVVAYAQGYLAVRYVVGRYGELALHRLLAGFTHNATTAETFREMLDLELATLEEDLRFPSDQTR